MPHLYLDTTTPWKGNYFDGNGRMLYVAQMPSKWDNKIYVYRTRNAANLPADKTTPSTTPPLELIGEISYSFTLCRGKIDYRGVTHRVNKLFRRGVEGYYGRNLIFRGEDGKEYEWTCGSRVCELTARDDSSKSRIAVYHRRRRGFIRKARPASLEIFEAGEHMTEFILILHMYLERLRIDRAYNDFQ